MSTVDCHCSSRSSVNIAAYVLENWLQESTHGIEKKGKPDICDQNLIPAPHRTAHSGDIVGQIAAIQRNFLASGATYSHSLLNFSTLWSLGYHFSSFPTELFSRHIHVDKFPAMLSFKIARSLAMSIYSRTYFPGNRGLENETCIRGTGVICDLRTKRVYGITLRQRELEEGSNNFISYHSNIIMCLNNGTP